jgi:hypothetical protein
LLSVAAVYGFRLVLAVVDGSRIVLLFTDGSVLPVIVVLSCAAIWEVLRSGNKDRLSVGLLLTVVMLSGSGGAALGVAAEAPDPALVGTASWMLFIVSTLLASLAVFRALLLATDGPEENF